MMQDKAIRTFGKLSIGMIVGMIAACAGSDTPPRTEEFDESVANGYGLGSPTGAAGSGGTANGGTGGRPPTGNGGRGGSGGSGTGGSAGAGPGGSANAGEAGSSAAGTTGMPAGPGDCDGFAILKTSCGSSGGCHGSGSPYSAFADTEGGAADFVDTDGVGPSCNGEGPIFDPGNPAASLVIGKINGTACGSKMPIGSATPFPPADLECVQDWISTLE